MRRNRGVARMLVGLIFWAAVGQVSAEAEADRVAMPSEKLVKTLIALEEEIRPETISVAFILEGELVCEGVFNCKHGARALILLPVNEKEGRRVRRVHEKIFLWNEKWGWFAYRETKIRGAETVQIFSETSGLVDVR